MSDFIYMRDQDDCLRAATAYVLGRPYGHVARHGALGRTAPEFWFRWWRWAARNGLRIRANWYAPGTLTEPPVRNGPWIGVVWPINGERTVTHAVVMEGRKLLYDPYRARPRRRVYLRNLIGHYLVEPIDQTPLPAGPATWNVPRGEYVLTRRGWARA